LPVLLSGLWLAGCDTAPQATAVAGHPMPPGKARLYFYRIADFSVGPQWTTVSLNGVAAGAAGPGTVFYRDVPPGRYRISAWSDRLYPDQDKTMVAAPGSTIFVRVEAQPYWGLSGWLWQGNTFIVAIVTIVAPSFGSAQISNWPLIPG
jgi:hypothetical protein